MVIRSLLKPKLWITLASLAFITVALVHLAKRWRWCLDRRLRGTGLTQARWSALLQLARGGEGMTQNRLAEHIGIEAASLVPLLDSLVRAWLVERRPDPSLPICSMAGRAPVRPSGCLSFGGFWRQGVGLIARSAAAEKQDG